MSKTISMNNNNISPPPSLLAAKKRSTPRKAVAYRPLTSLAKRDLFRPSPGHGPSSPFDRGLVEKNKYKKRASNGGGSANLVPRHIMVMKERRKLGSSATMARGAFLFSLAGLCAVLNKEMTPVIG